MARGLVFLATVAMAFGMTSAIALTGCKIDAKSSVVHDPLNHMQEIQAILQENDSK